MKYKQLTSTQSYTRNQLGQRHRIEKMKLLEEQTSVMNSLMTRQQQESSDLHIELDREKNLWRMASRHKGNAFLEKKEDIDLKPLPPIPSHRQVDRERICANPYPKPVARSAKCSSENARQN